MTIETMLELLVEGETQRAIAKRAGVSPQAICQRLRKLRVRRYKATGHVCPKCRAVVYRSTRIKPNVRGWEGVLLFCSESRCGWFGKDREAA